MVLIGMVYCCQNAESMYQTVLHHAPEGSIFTVAAVGNSNVTQLICKYIQYREIPGLSPSH